MQVVRSPSRSEGDARIYSRVVEISTYPLVLLAITDANKRCWSSTCTDKMPLLEAAVPIGGYRYLYFPELARSKPK